MYLDSLACRLKSAFIYVADFPRPGFLFPDLTSILETNTELIQLAIEEMIAFAGPHRPDVVVCVDSFGYVFGIPIALHTRSRIVLARRPGKLPRDTMTQHYSMCYDNERDIEIHRDAIREGDRVLIVDDIVGSGGTICAVHALVRRTGGHTLGAVCLAEIPKLEGRSKIEAEGLSLFTLVEL